jgi:tripartite-type tricarboxylate transporter receptor subunit TctC
MDIMLAYTEFDRPFAAPPGVPAEQLRALREGFEKMLADPSFAGEAKKLVDWDGSFLSGEQLQQRIEKTVTQPADVIKRIKQILQ